MLGILKGFRGGKHGVLLGIYIVSCNTKYKACKTIEFSTSHVYQCKIVQHTDQENSTSHRDHSPDTVLKL